MRLLGLRGRGLFPLITAVAVLIGAGNGLLGVCGPLIDVADDGFCPFVLEIFYLGITTGTTPTTYDPTANVSRLQMAAFLSRTVDGVLKRGSRRAALQQFWTPQNSDALGLTSVGGGPLFIASDGADLWLTDGNTGSVLRVRGSDGRLLETWTGPTNARGVLVAMGRVFVTGSGRLCRIDPSQAAGAVTTVASNLGDYPDGITFDGSRIWTSNAQSVSIVTPGETIPWTVTTVATGFLNVGGVLYDGSNVWVTNFDPGTGQLLKLDPAGAILQTVTVGSGPSHSVFDGTNIWVPGFFDGSVSVVRASTGAVLATLTGSGLNGPIAAAFDGQRVLVTSYYSARLFLWKAADLTPLGSVFLGGGPYGACSDGVNFFIALNSTGKLARF